MTGARAQHPLAESAPSLGLPLTICVLTYGPHASLARRFLTSLYEKTDPALFHLRAGLNEVEPGTHELFREYAKRFGNIEVFDEPVNVFKCPLMRRMFYEPAIMTAWTLWCDDDTFFTRADWLQRLALKIERKPRAAMWGSVHLVWRRDAFIRDWIRAARWYRGVAWQRGVNPQGQEATEFRFATGGFWAIRTEIIRQLDWPDPRLIQAHDDFLLGEALRQNQLEVGNFCRGVKINAAARRNPKAEAVRRIRP